MTAFSGSFAVKLFNLFCRFAFVFCACLFVCLLLTLVNACFD